MSLVIKQPGRAPAKVLSQRVVTVDDVAVVRSRSHTPDTPRQTLLAAMCPGSNGRFMFFDGRCWTYGDRGYVDQEFEVLSYGTWAECADIVIQENIKHA